jgi:hypothetical protein
MKSHVEHRDFGNNLFPGLVFSYKWAVRLWQEIVSISAG